MATKHQIMLVKTIHRRLKELLGDNKVTVTVSYTSASDILRITFKKVLKGAAFELPVCTSLKEYTLNPEILQHIVTNALEKMPKPPKWESMIALLAELRRRRDAYQTYTLQLPYNRYSGSYFTAALTTRNDATVAVYEIACHSFARNYQLNTSDLDLFESSFERDAGLASGGEYTRWREAGEPKRWTDPVDSLRALANPDNGVAPVMGTIRYADGRTEPLINWEFQGTQTGRTTSNQPNYSNIAREFTIIDETHDVSRVNTWDNMVAAFRHGGTMPTIGASWNSHAPVQNIVPTYFAGQPVDIPAPLPNTLFGLPVIWADELPPAQGSTNEQA